MTSNQEVTQIKDEGWSCHMKNTGRVIIYYQVHVTQHTVLYIEDKVDGYWAVLDYFFLLFFAKIKRDLKYIEKKTGQRRLKSHIFRMARETGHVSMEKRQFMESKVRTLCHIRFLQGQNKEKVRHGNIQKCKFRLSINNFLVT